MRWAAPAGPQRSVGQRGYVHCPVCGLWELAQLRRIAAGLAGSAAHPARLLMSLLTCYDLRDEPVAVGEAPFGGGASVLAVGPCLVS